MHSVNHRISPNYSHFRPFYFFLSFPLYRGLRLCSQVKLVKLVSPVKSSSLVTGSEYDALSQEMWDRFIKTQQTEETFRKKMSLWRYLYIAIKVHSINILHCISYYIQPHYCILCLSISHPLLSIGLFSVSSFPPLPVSFVAFLPRLRMI